MIRVTGKAKLIVNYDVELDMTEEEFDSLSERKQNEVLDDAIDWIEVCRNADVDEIDVDDLVEV
ncbi:hypothetical protein [Paenibacillus sp. IHBB 3054]|uniref:hypothetical protein n=1 Tax=Paenibacillus sp. IHBB 3054 TaxID=3425689 RepID=UPI003F6656CB